MFARFAAAVGAHTGIHRAEHERDRALQRVLIGLAVVLAMGWYLARTERPDPLAWLALPTALLYALWSLAYRRGLERQPQGLVATQYVMLVLDPVLTILALVGAAPILGALHPLVMVQIIRSGLRYGPRTLALSTASALAATALLIPLSPFWMAQEHLLRSFLVTLVLPLLLFGPLIRRLHANTGELELAAVSDALTGLANRRGLLARIERAADAARRAGGAMGVVAIDLDNFKSVNDTFGHAVGDRLLVQVAQAIRASCRSGDLAARVGGDEFVLVVEGLAGTDAAAQLQAVAAKLLNAVNAAAQAAVPTIAVSASLGVHCWRPGACGSTAEDILAPADQALYEAKRGGKSRIVVVAAAG